MVSVCVVVELSWRELQILIFVWWISKYSIFYDWPISHAWNLSQWVNFCMSSTTFFAFYMQNLATAVTSTSLWAPASSVLRSVGTHKQTFGFGLIHSVNQNNVCIVCSHRMAKSTQIAVNDVLAVSCFHLLSILQNCAIIFEVSFVQSLPNLTRCTESWDRCRSRHICHYWRSRAAYQN